jgi:hypothetical protein
MLYLKRIPNHASLAELEKHLLTHITADIAATLHSPSFPHALPAHPFPASQHPPGPRHPHATTVPKALNVYFAKGARKVGLLCLVP